MKERGCVADQPQQFTALRLTLRAHPRSFEIHAQIVIADTAALA
jgi:hypothetical protein